MKKLEVKITFTEELLGTASSDPNIHREYIASKAPNALSTEEEVAALGVEAVDEKGRTVFPRGKDGVPILWDYQVKGFFKDACGMLSRVPGSKSNKLKAYKKVIDGLVFTGPRSIPLVIPGTVGRCDRPLRAQTAQGERIALASSETVPTGTTCMVTITILDDNLEALVTEWLDYGALRGLGQWRNSGKGRFSYELV